MVYAFTVSSVVRGYHEYKDVWRSTFTFVTAIAVSGTVSLNEPLGVGGPALHAGWKYKI